MSLRGAHECKVCCICRTYGCRGGDTRIVWAVLRKLYVTDSVMEEQNRFRKETGEKSFFWARGWVDGGCTQMGGESGGDG